MIAKGDAFVTCDVCAFPVCWSDYEPDTSHLKEALLFLETKKISREDELIFLKLQTTNREFLLHVSLQVKKKTVGLIYNEVVTS